MQQTSIRNRGIRWLLAQLGGLAIIACQQTTLTGPTVIQVESNKKLAEVAVKQFQKYVPHKITVTDKDDVWNAWPNENKWLIADVANGTVIEGDDGDEAIICEPGESFVTFAVTKYSVRTIYIGDCATSNRDVVIAHEIGHLVGATDQNEGVMTWSDPPTIEPAQCTIDELIELY